MAQQPSMGDKIFTKVWLARAVIQWVFTAVTVACIAWAISFKVSDYVVQANTNSINTTLQTLAGSVDRLNETMVSMNETMADFHGNLTQLASDSAVHRVQLTNVATELNELEEKLRNNGIQVSYPVLDKQSSKLMANSIVDAFATNAEFIDATSEVWNSSTVKGPVFLQISTLQNGLQDMQ